MYTIAQIMSGKLSKSKVPSDSKKSSRITPEEIFILRRKIKLRSKNVFEMQKVQHLCISSKHLEWTVSIFDGIVIYVDAQK